MGAYNRVNGEPSCASDTLIAGKLRGEWGFDGHFLSDCGAIRDFHTGHKVTSTPQESAALAVKKGCDLNCGNIYAYVLAAVEEGLLSEEDVTRSCVRLMATRYKLGLLGDSTAFDGLGITDVDTEEANALARTAAERSMVLVKNDGVLPLDPDGLKTVAVIGPNADTLAALQGNYHGTTSRCVTYLQGIRRALEGKARVLYAVGSHLWKTNEESCVNLNVGDRIAEAVACAKAADAVILCLGLDETLEGEEGDAHNGYASGDKESLELPAIQKKLLAAVTAVGKPVVTVISAGSALRVEEGNAILWSWYPGQAGGDALANILFGKVSPSGKLPVTMYRSLDELPEFTDYSMKNRTYRYFEGEALYPFGYGLGYCPFRYEDAVYENGAVTVTVRSEGCMTADEVVQVYVEKNDSPFDSLHPSLCGFARVTLDAGDFRRVTVPVSEDAFFVYDDAGCRIPAGDRFTFYVGGSQPDAVSCRLTGTEPAKITVSLR